MMQHPDATLKVGAKRTAAGLEWTLYKNQFGLAWKAGPLAVNIRLSDMTAATHKCPYMIGSVGYATFDKCASDAVKFRYKEYVKAKQLVADYEQAERGSGSVSE